MTTVSCLHCGRELKTRGFGRHQLAKSHVANPRGWSEYSRPLRLTMYWCKRQALEQLKKKFVFAQYL